MLQMKAMWAPDWARYSRGTDAQKVANEIYGISDTPTTEQIVEMASNPETESFKLFDWDNDVAGPKWRKYQAGLIMRSLKVEFIQGDDEEEKPKQYEPVRLFYGDPTQKEGFVAITTVMKDKDVYEKLLEKAKMEIKSYRKKYSMLKELTPLFEVIDAIE